MSRGLVAAGALALVGCASGPGRPAAAPETVAVSEDAAARRARLISEMQDTVLTSYERDDPPELDTSMIDPRIGTARIGAGPGDLYLAGDLARAPSRWPLAVERTTRTEVRSKHMQIWLAADQTAAWMSDEVSWRIELCGRMSMIPMRVTALYAHDGDRWIPVFEHLSYGFPPTPLVTTPPKQIKTEVASKELADELAGVVGRGLLHSPRDLTVLAQDASALVLGPDADSEWHASYVPSALLPTGQLEDHRIGLVGRNQRTPTIAYWIGYYIADAAARPGVAGGKVRMRVTFVFEKRPVASRDDKPVPPAACASESSKPGACRWTLVQSHFSQPVTDEELTNQVFGTALISDKPLTLDCTDGTSAGDGN